MSHAYVDTLEHFLAIQQLLVQEEVLEAEIEIPVEILRLLRERVVQEVTHELELFDVVLITD